MSCRDTNRWPTCWTLKVTRRTLNLILFNWELKQCGSNVRSWPGLISAVARHEGCYGSIAYSDKLGLGAVETGQTWTAVWSVY